MKRMEERYGQVKNGSFGASIVPQFPHSDRSYKCICGLVHVKLATIVIGGISLIYLLTSIFWRIFIYFGPKHVSLSATILSMIPLVVATAATIMLFIGIIQKQCELLLPFIFIEIVAALASAVFLIMVTIFVACNTRYIIDALIGELPEDSQNHSLAKALLISILAVQLLLAMWATRVVSTCYRYFDELAAFQKAHTIV